MIIYKITNITDSKLYIGCTTKTLAYRWARHIIRRNDSTLLARAIKFYGKDKFKVEQIDSADSKSEMFEKEKYWIKFFNSNNIKIGYNLTNGGDSGPIFYGKNNPMFGRKNFGAIAFNQKRKGIKLSDEHKRKVAESGKGRKHSEESKMKMSKSRKAKWARGGYDFVGEAISKAKTGKESGKRKAIYCINNSKTYSCAKEAAMELSLTQPMVCEVVNGKRPHTKQFKFIIANN